MLLSSSSCTVQAVAKPPAMFTQTSTNISCCRSIHSRNNSASMWSTSRSLQYINLCLKKKRIFGWVRFHSVYTFCYDGHVTWKKTHRKRRQSMIGVERHTKCSRKKWINLAAHRSTEMHSLTFRHQNVEKIIFGFSSNFHNFSIKIFRQQSISAIQFHVVNEFFAINPKIIFSIKRRLDEGWAMCAMCGLIIIIVVVIINPMCSRSG